MAKNKGIEENGSRLSILGRRTIIDPPGEHFAIKMGEGLSNGGFYDLAKSNRLLTPGATYRASIGDHKVTFKVDASAKSGRGPVVSRLLRFQSS